MLSSHIQQNKLWEKTNHVFFLSKIIIYNYLDIVSLSLGQKKNIETTGYYKKENLC